MHTGRGDDKVADARQTRERVDIAAHGHAQPGDLRDAAGNEGGAGIVPVAQAGGDAHAQRDDVLHGTAELHALDVLVGVDAHDAVGEHLLHELCRLHVRAGRDDGGGQVDGHLFGVGGAGQRHQVHLLRAALPAQLIGQNLRHGVQGVRLDALGHIHDDLPLGHIGPGLGSRGAHEDRRHRKQQDVLVPAHFLHALGKAQLLRDLHSGQIGVHTGARQSVDLLFDGRPDQHIVPAHAQHPCQSHAPGARTQDTDFPFRHVQILRICRAAFVAGLLCAAVGGSSGLIVHETACNVNSLPDCTKLARVSPRF